MDDDAVSPVVGVILMVAITVVLAAVIFLLINNLVAKNEHVPLVSWQEDEHDNKLVAIEVRDRPLYLRDLDVADEDPDDDCVWRDLQDAVLTGADELRPGFVLDCSALDVESTVTILHKPSDSVMTRVVFLP